MADRTLDHTQLDESEPLLTTGADAGGAMRRIDRFTVLEQIGSGAMGVVYAAYDPELDRRVALKLLRSDRWAAGDARAKSRVLAEARAMARVSDPNVVTVYEVGSYADAIFVAMEFVEGATLRQWLNASQRHWREIVDVFVQLARGLDAVHVADLVHRDIKLDNLMLRNDGRAQVLDFGIAMASDARAPAGGALVGTPGYMAPEQFAGDAANARTDQWALCVSLYEALYGSKPFNGANITELAVAVSEAKLPTTPRGRNVPAVVHAVVTRGLALAPDDRWSSLRTLAAALDDASGHRRRRARMLTIGGGLVGAIGLAGGVALAMHEPACNGGEPALARVWNPERSDSLAATFTAQAPFYGADAWQRTAVFLHSYGEEWSAQQRDACEAERTGLQTAHVLDLRVRCLERRLAQLDALLAALEHADAASTEHALEAAAQLPAIAGCADVDALIGRASAPPPEQAAEVDAIERELDAASAEQQLHRVELLASTLAELAPRIDALAYEPLVARHSFLRSVAADELGEFAEAGAAAERSYFAARTYGDSSRAVEAAAQRAWIFGERETDADRAALWLRLADAELDEHVDSQARMRLMQNHAELLLLQGRYEEALVGFERARERVDEQTTAPIAREIDRVSLTHNIAITLYELGRNDEALATAREVLASEEAIFGPDHPELAATITSIGLMLEHTGDYTAAIEVHQRAVAIRERALGPDDPLLAGSLSQLASAQETVAPLDARATCERALAILERIGRGQTREAAICVSLLGHVSSSLGDEAAAREAFAHSLAIYEALVGADHPLLAAPLSNLGGSETKLGRHDDAELHLRRSIALQETAHGRNAAGIGFALANLGATLVARGQIDEGIAVLERALARHTADGPAPEVLGNTAMRLARALAPRDTTRARALADEAKRAYRRAQPARDATIAEIDAWLATLPQ